MTGTLVEIRSNERESQRKLALDISTRAAVADLCRERWPSCTAKMAARAWDLTMDEARSAVAGRASFTTYDKIKRAGGWAVILAVEARVLGRGVDQYLIEARASHNEQAERFAALLGSSGPMPAAGLPDPGSLDAERDERRVFGRRGMGSR